MSRADDKRERIIDAATELISRWGYTKTSLDDIARHAHIAKATIYYYFPSKEDLFIAAIGVKAEELFSAIEAEIAAARGFEDKLSRVLRLPMRYIFEDVPLLAEALRQFSPQYFSKLETPRADYRRRMLGLLGKVFDHGKEQGIVDAQLDTEKVCEMINDWFLLGDSWVDNSENERIIQRFERDHELIIQLILHGILNLDAKPPTNPARRSGSKK